MRRSKLRAGGWLALAFAALLAGCAEEELILPGEREDLRGDLEGLPGEPAPDESESVARAISLPGQSVNAAWAQAQGSQIFRTAHPALSTAPQRLWSVPIGAGDARRARITAQPVVAGGLIYTLDSAARVSAVSPAGQVAWSVDLVPAGEDPDQATGGGMSYADGVLYVSSGFGRLTALDAASGAVRWVQRLGATGSGRPTIHEGMLYLVAGDETGWAIETGTGRVAWRVSAAPSIANVLGAPAPAIAGEFVIFGFGSGEVIAAFRRGGTVRWTTTVAGQRQGRVVARIGDITGAPVVAGDRIYVANHSGRIAALNRSDGEMIWSARQGAADPVWPAGDAIFAISDLNQLLRLDAGSGEIVWVRDLPGYVKDKPRKRGARFAHYGPVVAGGRVVVASNDGLLRFFAPETGALAGSVEVPGGATTAPTVANRTLYVVSADGRLHAFR